MHAIASRLFFLLLFVSVYGFSQTPSAPSSGKLDRPKLVVGLVVDQMRWDFLYRYYDRYGQGGFKRILNQGFSAENAHIPYAQTVTAAGHASVYTGSVPAINGIMGNDWYDRSLGRYVYCVEDDSVTVLGGIPQSEPMSPRNLWTTTISDELRLATNFRSKVVGVAIKDRGSILPAGHAGTAYWYESGNGNWVSSSWYMNSLPKWVNDFNAKRWVDTFNARNWNTLYPIETYLQSTKDDVPWEGVSGLDKKPVFPHITAPLVGKNYGVVRATPWGNTLTLNFAKTALEAEALGQDDITDLLAISLSSPDYIGHQYGPNSIEIEDTYLRLDMELEAFFNFLDEKVGKDQYLFFITADHGVAHVPSFLHANNMKVKTLSSNLSELESAVLEKFKVPNIIEAQANYHLYLNYHAIDSVGASREDIEAFIVQQLRKQPHVLTAFSYDEFDDAILPKDMKEMFVMGYNPRYSGDIQLVLKSGYFHGGSTGTTHGSWNPYDSHIPSAFMGWGVRQGKTNRVTHMTDIAATLAALLRIQMPNGCVGTPITELMK